MSCPQFFLAKYLVESSRHRQQKSKSCVKVKKKLFVKPKSGFFFESSATSNKFYSFLCVLSNFRPTLTKYDYNYMLVVVCFSHHGLLLERVMALALLLIAEHPSTTPTLNLIAIIRNQCTNCTALPTNKTV